MKYKHFFFDMDGTVTPSRSLIEGDVKQTFEKLFSFGTVAVISGSHNDQMTSQVDGLPIIKMGQNGNHVIDSDGTELWYDKFAEELKQVVFDHTDKILAAMDYEVPDTDDLLEDRGSQISLSIFGHHADPAEKKAFDGDFAKRKVLLEQFPFSSDAVEVKLGGSTCLDYIKTGRNKGYNIAKIIEHKGWNKDECVFFGDALFPGGNDETVVDVIETRPVKDPQDCARQLEELMSEG